MRHPPGGYKGKCSPHARVTEVTGLGVYMSSRELDNTTMVNASNDIGKNRVKILCKEVAVGQPKDIHVISMERLIDIIKERQHREGGVCRGSVEPAST